MSARAPTPTPTPRMPSFALCFARALPHTTPPHTHTRTTPPSPHSPLTHIPPCRAVEGEVRALCEGALAAARDVVAANRRLHEALSARLTADERLEGAALQVRGWG